MAERRVAYRLPLAGWPRAELVTDWGWRGARLLVGGAAVLDAPDREALVAGVRRFSPELQAEVEVRLADEDGEVVAGVSVGGRPAPREDALAAPPVAGAAWVHAGVALLGSAAGLAASSVYLHRAHASADPWALKMAIHMAGWHLLLVLTLFPASIWAGRPGIRLVQVVSLVFFAIHLGIAIADAADLPSEWVGAAIALLNAGSGAAFLAAVLQGQRAYRDMDPLRALAAQA